MQQNLINTEPRFCYKCHHPASVVDVRCTRCGGVLYTKSKIRMLGGLLVFLGGFIAVLMAAIMVFAAGVLAKADASKLEADESKMLMAVGVMGLTFAVGVAFSIAGLWQIIVGRRNTIIVWIALILVGVLLVAGKIFTSMA